MSSWCSVHCQNSSFVEWWLWRPGLCSSCCILFQICSKPGTATAVGDRKPVWWPCPSPMHWLSCGLIDNKTKRSMPRVLREEAETELRENLEDRSQKDEDWERQTTLVRTHGKTQRDCDSLSSCRRQQGPLCFVSNSWLQAWHMWHQLVMLGCRDHSTINSNQSLIGAIKDPSNIGIIKEFLLGGETCKIVDFSFTTC